MSKLVMAARNEEGLGKLQRDALRFARRYPGWHTYELRGVTSSVVQSLERRSLVKTNKFHQFKAV